MGESRRKKQLLERLARRYRDDEETKKMDPMPVVCSKCQANVNAVPGTTHDECGGVYVPAGMMQKREFKFSTPQAMMVFMLLDRLVGDTESCMNLLGFMGAQKIIAAVQQIREGATRLRDAFYKQDQGGIVIVGPGGMPPPPAGTPPQ